MTARPAARSLSIVRVIARLNIGGPARHVVLLDRGLRARGHQTLLVHGSPEPDEGSLAHLAATYGVETVVVNELGRRISPFGDVVAFLQLVRTIFRVRPDVVHTHTAKAGTLGRLAAFAFNSTRRRGRRCVLVHTFHGHVLSGYFGPIGSQLVRLVERSLALITDRVVTISPSQKTELVERFKIAPADRTTIIPLGLDLEPLLRQGPNAPTLRGALSIRDDAVVVGYVGRFVPIKDLRTLVSAFATASSQDDRLVLLLAGDGPVRAEIETLVRERGISDRVRFVGWTENLCGLYATVDICALSSLNEGTPVAVIEAMAAGKAVVATTVGGVPDVIQNGATGILIPPGDSEALCRALLSLARDSAERFRLGEAARQAVSDRFSPTRLVDDVENLYSAALSEKRRS